MTLSRLQLPPRPSRGVTQDVGGPPAIRIFFSLPSAKNPMNRLSGDQNGKAPPSVPGIGLAARVATGRSQIWNASSAPATNTTFRPSGDTATCVAVPVPPALGPPNDVLSGGTIVNCTGPAAGVTSPARRECDDHRREQGDH